MGIHLRNFRPYGAVQQAFGYGTDVLVPTCDEEYVVASTSIADNTALGDLTLNTSGIGAAGGILLWPQRLFIVVRNRGLRSAGGPCIAQCNPTFAGNDQFVLRVTGALNGTVQTEDVIVNISTLTSPSGFQRAHITTQKFYDEVTSIALTSTADVSGGASGFGTTTPMQLSVGLGNDSFGAANNNRFELMTPVDLPSSSSLKRAFGYDETNYAVGSGTGLVQLRSEDNVCLMPGRVGEFSVGYGSWSGQVADTLTLTAHGLTDGQCIMVQSLADGVPGGMAEGTLYYVALAAANTICLATSQAAFAAATDLTADTLTKTAHGLANGTPVVLYDDGLGIPTGLSASTKYYVVGTAANTFQLAATSGGAAINITGANVARVAVLPLVEIAAAGLFADNDLLRVMRPKRMWRRVRLVYSEKGVIG